ncbi:substrate-binding domain-containing protein [Oceanibacterium hippocampi]|uniref:Periplasmic protein TorT n=1 Tax=Oceanibacterium hippocampi TaxID=745714 RepID=A0A1Y5TTZ7_9PROT|nr:substrate-binding domain-containing protein [Oceanibacterium hippocampi]SLN72186.1 Periplasmic protein TorT precursor [Oceanibacterium hippocampi]
MRISKLIAASFVALIATAGVGSTSVSAADDFDRLRGLIDPAKPKEQYRIAFAAVHFVDAYWKGVAYGILDEAKKAGVDVVRVTSAGGYGNLQQQIAQLEALAALDLDALIIGAATFDGLRRPLKTLAENGVKIIAMDLSVNSPDVVLRVGQNQVDIGFAMAEYICQKDPDALVITIPGPAGVEWTADRLRGVKQAAEKCPDMKLVGNEFKASTLLEDGQSQAADLLTVYPDADYIYAAAVSLGTGAARAIERAGSHAKVVTGGFTDNTVELMEKGLIDMVVSEPGILIGRVNLQYAIRALNGDDLPHLAQDGDLPYLSYNLPPRTVSRDNLSSYNLDWYDMPPSDWDVPASQ